MVKIKVNNYKSSIEDPYSKIAWMYDVWSSLTESKALNLALKFAAVKNGESFLEVAVGTGKFFEQIVKLNPKGRNEGIDISKPMLKRARRRAKKYKNVRLVREDASKLPYDSNTFDVLVSNYMFDLLSQRKQSVCLKEFKRVLKPSGRLVVTTMTHGREWYSKAWDTIAKKFPSLLTGCHPVDLELTVKNPRAKARGVPGFLSTRDLCLLTHKLKQGVCANTNARCIKKSEFKIKKSEYLTQNTFPSRVILGENSLPS